LIGIKPSVEKTAGTEGNAKGQRRTTIVASVALLALMGPALAQRNATVAAADGSALPFPGAPSASIAAPRLQDFKHVRRILTAENA
jgi:hypothetical protein